MVETILLILLFVRGAYFGSFFTLATYRLPKKENITHKHSYCPNCQHKLGILDLVPIASYFFLGGKCRYCKQKIGIRYPLFEILTGIVFVLFGLSLKMDIYAVDLSQWVYLVLGILYLTSLFLLAGIDKEQNKVQKSVLFFGVFVSLAYMIYSYTLHRQNVYAYVIYLSIMVLLLLADTVQFQKKLNYNDMLQTLVLLVYMLIFSGLYITISTVVCTILIIGFINIIKGMRGKKQQKVTSQKQPKPIVFYLCVSNIIMLILNNFLINYYMK